MGFRVKGLGFKGLGFRVTYAMTSGLYWDNGKEHGNYYNILGLYRDNGKENGNDYRIMEKKMEATGVILGLYRGNLLA